MKVFGRLSVVLWTLALGAVVLFVFFTFLARISPDEVARVTAVVATLATLFTLRTMSVGRELRRAGGNPFLREAHNKARERRGF